MTRKIVVTSIAINVTREDSESGAFSGTWRDVVLPEDCTLEQAIEELTKLKDLAERTQ